MLPSSYFPFFLLQGCQIDQTQFIYYNIGDANSVTFSYNGQNLIGTYTSDDQMRCVLAPVARHDFFQGEM